MEVKMVKKAGLQKIYSDFNIVFRRLTEYFFSEVT